MALTPAQQAHLAKLGRNAPGGNLNAELIEKSRAAIADRMYGVKETSNQELKILIEEILSDPQCAGCRPAYAPPKDRQTAAEKVQRDYGGDWYDLKDVVRATIIAPFDAVTRIVQTKIRALFGLGVGRPGLNIIKDMEVRAGGDPCGYSGMNFVVRLSSHRPAEIQVNVPVMIYGKDKEKDSKGILGSKQFNEIKSRFMVEGGYGHTLYEMYRVDKAGPVGQQAAYLSSRYYNSLRGVPRPQTAGELGLEIRTFMKDPRGYCNKTDSAFLSQTTRGRR